MARVLIIPYMGDDEIYTVIHEDEPAYQVQDLVKYGAEYLYQDWEIAEFEADQVEFAIQYRLRYLPFDKTKAIYKEYLMFKLNGVILNFTIDNFPRAEFLWSRMEEGEFTPEQFYCYVLSYATFDVVQS